MLCRVDEQPVIVFVDKLESDRAQPLENSGAGVQLFREQRDGLVFYEVTPFAEPKVLKFLETTTRASENGS